MPESRLGCLRLDDMEEFYENNNDINIEANNSMEDFSTHH
jgi:hypothetical protein